MFRFCHNYHRVFCVHLKTHALIKVVLYQCYNNIAFGFLDKFAFTFLHTFSFQCFVIFLCGNLAYNIFTIDASSYNNLAYNIFTIDASSYNNLAYNIFTIDASSYNNLAYNIFTIDASSYNNLAYNIFTIDASSYNNFPMITINTFFHKSPYDFPQPCFTYLLFCSGEWIHSFSMQHQLSFVLLLSLLTQNQFSLYFTSSSWGKSQITEHHLLMPTKTIRLSSQTIVQTDRIQLILITV